MHRRVISIAFACLLLVAVWCGRASADTTVNDVTGLNPIRVQQVVAPTSIEQIVEIVRSHRGPISIGGGRFSMGGQTATDGALQIDMRAFNKVVSFSPEKREITVQTGMTWRQLQECIDPRDLSVEIMQTYANFTVGGSLSVNVHGRYVRQGPLVLSVKSIRVVLPDGTLSDASPTENAELFYGAIGGYGALGVIVEATLKLTDNVHVERTSVVMPLAAYRDYFKSRIGNDPRAVFHNADLYPPAFDTVRATTYRQTDRPITVSDRLIPADSNYADHRRALEVVSDWPEGKWIRQHVIDPWFYHGTPVEWRNYEASYDASELEPASRERATYVLQEYFVPEDRLDDFVGHMRAILNSNDVNAINVSIRHARADPGTLLAWARTDVFSLVLFYKQGTSAGERRKVAPWTRELIDAAITEGGTYYLPYQVLATREQFLAAYPRASEFFALKQRLDPTNKFRNRLWDAYYDAARASR
jgi:FAD/FMN-containing dehydrogenase